MGKVYPIRPPVNAPSKPHPDLIEATMLPEHGAITVRSGPDSVILAYPGFELGSHGIAIVIPNDGIRPIIQLLINTLIKIEGGE